MGPDIPRGPRLKAVRPPPRSGAFSMKIHVLTQFGRALAVTDTGHRNRQREGQGLAAKRSLESRRQASSAAKCAPKVLSTGLWVRLREVRSCFS